MQRGGDRRASRWITNLGKRLAGFRQLLETQPDVLHKRLSWRTSWLIRHRFLRLLHQLRSFFWRTACCQSRQTTQTTNGSTNAAGDHVGRHFCRALQDVFNTAKEAGTLLGLYRLTEQAA